jgi:hypothetical protein
MRKDLMTAFWDAIQRAGGAIGRGPRRWYVEIHPQAFGGFADLCSHPWVVAMCGAALGSGYKIVEIGFDTPFQGAMKQPCTAISPRRRRLFATERSPRSPSILPAST